jgi:dTDP-4-dehydrorhamnose 3,5-epimerase
MIFEPLPTLKEVILIKPERHHDNRGFFYESFKQSEFEKNGIYFNPVQSNASHNIEMLTLRGLHFQKDLHAQAKLVKCSKGSILDFVVDVREYSPTFMKIDYVYLDVCLPSKNNLLYIPKGYAHGFVTLEENTEVTYLCDSEYNKESESGINAKLFEDFIIERIDAQHMNTFGWDWHDLIISDKDKNW